MTHDERDCRICRTVRDETMWLHIALFVALIIVGFAIGLGWHP